MSNKALVYLADNRERLLKKLNEFLSIPSVSTDSEHKGDIKQAADFLATYLAEIGFENIDTKDTGGHPLVYAEYNGAGSDASTVLFYGHYDVQPVDPIDQWKSDPFKPEVREGRLYARGSSDDKGQVFMNLAVFEAIMKTDGKLPLNVKICIEGEEEIGSENLYDILQEKKELFEADFAVISDSGMVRIVGWFSATIPDFAVISDSGMVAENQPTILYGLKGFTGIEITVAGPDHDLHSGIYGGAVRNPVMALTQILASMKNEDEIITIDGFYSQVEALTDAERQ